MTSSREPRETQAREARAVSRVAQVVRVALAELWALVVDDGLLALAALGAVGVAYLLSRSDVLGPVDLVGWILVALVAGSVAASVWRAVGVRRRAERPPPPDQTTRTS